MNGKLVEPIGVFLCAVFLLLSVGCEDPARGMSFGEAMDKYEWDNSEMLDYVFSEFSKYEILEICQDRYGQDVFLEWVAESVDFEYVIDAWYDVYSDQLARDLILDAVADRYSIQEFIDHR